MTALLAIPVLESLHPMIIHFPIALLLVAPVFILIAAMLPPPKGRPFMASALVLLGMGTASLFFAVPTGEAAAKFLDHSGDAARELLQVHQSLAFETRGIFVMLLVLYISIMLVPKVLHRDGRLFSTVLPLAFLLLYSAGAVVLVNTAHEGGRLVHDSGIVSSSPSPAQPATHSGN